MESTTTSAPLLVFCCFLLTINWYCFSFLFRCVFDFLSVSLFFFLSFFFYHLYCFPLFFKGFGRCQLSPNYGPLSPSFIFLCLVFLVSEGSGRKPPAARGANRFV